MIIYSVVYENVKLNQCRLNTVANQRNHGSTGQQPHIHYERDEQAKMQAYLAPTCIQDKASGITRQVDKTSLISWQSNKYSVPMAYQNSKVSVLAADGRLLISDLASSEIIAEHAIGLEKNQLIKNPIHYRDKEQRVQTLEAALEQQIGATSGQQLCALFKASSPTIYKDQLRGAHQVLQAHTAQYGSIATDLVKRLLTSPRLTVTLLRDTLEAFQQHPERLSAETAEKNNVVRVSDTPLNGQPTGQGVNPILLT